MSSGGKGKLSINWESFPLTVLCWQPSEASFECL